MNTEFEHELFDHFARIGKAVSNSHRIALLYYLSQCERSVEVLANLAGLSIANTSQHLQTLRHAGLVDSRKEAQHVHYRLTDEDGILKLLDAMQQLAQRRLGEVERLVEDHIEEEGEIESVSAEELLRRIQNGEVIVLDVRPTEEFAAGHLEGAINIPLERLEEQSQRLPSGHLIVAYCRGRYCMMSQEAVRRLRAIGLEAHRLGYGYPELRLAGYPIEREGEAHRREPALS